MVSENKLLWEINLKRNIIFRETALFRDVCMYYITMSCRDVCMLETIFSLVLNKGIDYSFETLLTIKATSPIVTAAVEIMGVEKADKKGIVVRRPRIKYNEFGKSEYRVGVGGRHFPVSKALWAYVQNSLGKEEVKPHGLSPGDNSQYWAAESIIRAVGGLRSLERGWMDYQPSLFLFSQRT